ncbi:TPA: iron-sulfur cluster assembly scaffold protein, partial [Thermoplasmata archaeon]|nr:iron-sulfur cluster assembly scaffold protein [Thermoplasmata archaeon]
MTDEEGADLDEVVDSIMSVLEEQDSRIYSKEVIAEFRSPTNVGCISSPDGTGVADGLCNDTMEITIKVEGDRIAKCMFFTDGCGATIACGSRLTRMVSGMTVDEAMAIESERLIDLLGGLPADHKHC